MGCGRTGALRELHKHKREEVTGTGENYGTRHFIENILQALPLSRGAFVKKNCVNLENVIVGYQSVPCG